MRWYGAMAVAAMISLAPAVRAAEPTPAPLRTTEVPDGFTLAAVGDLLELRPLMPLQDPGFLAVNRIVKGADVAFGNDELPIVDVSVPGIYPEAENGGSNIYAIPSVAADFKAQGFTMVARANNHSTDWGVAGMFMTDSYLDAAGIMHAGTGRDEDAARRVRFVETRWGRIGLASTTSTFEGNEPAGAAQRDVAGRPGASVVHTVPAIVVDRATYDGLKRYYGAPVYHIDDKVTPDSITVFGQPYVVGTKPGIRYTMDKGDVASIVRALRQGNQLSNLLVFSVHCHEDASGIGNDVPQGAFLRDLAHDAIDAGADVFVSHGPHQVGGIEIYKRKPIFYSLGNYIFQIAAMENIWPEGYAQFGVDPSKGNDADVSHRFLAHYFAESKWWQSVVVTVTYRHNAAETIKLYPIDLRRDRPAYVRGIPQPASPAEATDILKRISALSEPYGTHVDIANGVGTIHIVQ